MIKMRKNLIVMALVAVMSAVNPISVAAQGLGGLLKKGKEALEKVANTPVASDSKEEKQSKGSVTKLENGIEMINPMSEYIDVTPVGLYGISTSENYGNVFLVLNVMMKEPANKAGFGGVGNDKMVAVDSNGKLYEGASGTLSFETPEGIPVRIVMDQPQLTFEGVKKNISVMPMVKFGILIDAYHKGMLTLKNVPILWDETPEE